MQVYLQYKYYITVTKTGDGTPYRSHGHVLLRFRGNVVMKMGTQQQQNNQDSASNVITAQALIYVVAFTVLAGSGAAAVDVTVLSCGADKSVTLKVVNAQSKFVYIDGCMSSEGENGGSGLADNDEDVTFMSCNLEWDTKYQVQVTLSQGVIAGSDFRKDIECVRDDSTITVQAGVTVSPKPATASIQSDVKPTATMRINQAAGDHTAAAVVTVPVATQLYMHIRLDDSFISATPDFDILASKITVSNGLSPAVTLIGGATPGCNDQPYFAEVTDEEIGYLKVAFQAFMFTKTGLQVDPMNFEATLGVCVGAACQNVVCPGGGTGAGRKRRAVSNSTVLEEISVSSTINVVSYQTETDEPNKTGEQGGQSEERGSDTDLCLDKNGFYGLIAAFGIALLLSGAASCFLFQKARGQGMLRPLDENQLYYKNSFESRNHSFRH